MSIVILGIEFPVGDELLVIRSDGTCTKYHTGVAAFWEDGETSRPTMIATLHEHGRLIDADALDRAFSALRFNEDGSLKHWDDRKNWCLHGSEVETLLAKARTIIPADPEGGVNDG